MSLPFPEPTAPAASRAEVFLRYLDYFRSRLVSKLEGLPGGELRRSRLPSGWAPIELAKHLAYVEMRWLEWGFEGRDQPDVWGDRKDGRWYVGPDETLADLVAALDAQAARTRAIVAAHDLADTGQPGERWGDADPPALERVLFHLLQEYARHAGQLDIVSELGGGPVGELEGRTERIPDQRGQALRPDRLRSAFQLRKGPPAPGGDAVGGVHRVDALDLAARGGGPRQVQPFPLVHQPARVLHRPGAAEHLGAQLNVRPAGLLGELAERGGREVLAVVQPAARGRPVAAVRRAVVVAHQQHTVVRVEQDDPGRQPHREPVHAVHCAVLRPGPDGRGASIDAMAGTNAASSQAQAQGLTVALDLPSARMLADQISTIQDLQFVMECCKRLLTELVKPDDEREPVLPQALWSAALMAYDRCFTKGKRFGLTADDVRGLPLEGQVLKFHNWIVDERNQLARHPADPYDVARVGAVLSGPSGGQDERRGGGITVLSASHILVDGAGVRQLGALASELAKQAAEKAQKQESTVLADAQKISLDKLYALPPLPVGAPDEA